MFLHRVRVWLNVWLLPVARRIDDDNNNNKRRSADDLSIIIVNNKQNQANAVTDRARHASIDDDEERHTCKESHTIYSIRISGHPIRISGHIIWISGPSTLQYSNKRPYNSNKRPYNSNKRPYGNSNKRPYNSNKRLARFYARTKRSRWPTAYQSSNVRHACPRGRRGLLEAAIHRSNNELLASRHKLTLIKTCSIINVVSYDLTILRICQE